MRRRSSNSPVGTEAPIRRARAPVAASAVAMTTSSSEGLAKLMGDIDADGDGNIGIDEVHKWLADRGAVEWLPYRKGVKQFYQGRLTQMVVSVVILFNFVSNIVQKEIDPYAPEAQQYAQTWQNIDDVCAILFMVELVINLYGSFFRPFFRSAWNWLDLLVVILGICSLARIREVSEFRIVRVIRTFRVARIFKRFESLNKILTSLFFAVPGVLNALAITLIVMSIYAVVAVDLFRDFGSDGQYETDQTYVRQRLRASICLAA